MFDSIFRIWSIALYEAKVIMRGWLFRIALLLPVAFLLVIMLTRLFQIRSIGILFQVFYNAPSTIPWIVTVFYTIYSCIVLAAVSTNSGWREWKLDSLEAIRIRPWSNIEHAVGKAAGQIFCFIIMTVAVLLVTLGISIFSHGMITFGAGYLLYPLIICAPAFFFVSGLSMLAARVFRNQMLSLLVVTAVILLSVFTADRYFHLLDMTAFRMPLFFSRMTGFSFPELIARQRLLYLVAGLMMVCVTALIPHRPPGRRLTTAVTSIAAVVLLVFCFYAGFGYADHFSTGVELRKSIREISRTLRPVPLLEPLEYHIDVDQEGRGIDCSVRIVLENRSGSSVDRYVFTLNPGLDVEEVTDRSGSIDFERDLHLLTVVPPGALRPGEKDTIDIRYTGAVDARAMFSDVAESVRSADRSLHDMSSFMVDMPGTIMFRVPRDIAPQRYDYMLLVPDAMWYPVPGLPYDPLSPECDRRSFSIFRLKVNPREGLNAVSQGKRTATENGGFLFEPECPLTGITLALGEFRARTIKVDSLEYILQSTPSSEELFVLMDCVADTLPTLIAEARDKLEYSLGLGYPFERMTFLEVPASFFPFNRPLRETGFGLTQPEIFLVHEGGIALGLRGLPAWLDMIREYRVENEEPPEDRDRNIVIHSTRFLLGSLGRDDAYNLFPMYFRHAVGIEVSRYPHLGLMLEHMAGEGVLFNQRGRHWIADGITDSERASRMIIHGGFLESVMDPDNYRWAGNLVRSWASHHYYLIDALSEKEMIAGFIRDLTESNRFRNIDEDVLLESFAERFGFRLESVVIDLENPVDIPGYLYGDFDCCEVIEGERKYYKASFDVINREGVRGVIAVTAALKYPKAVRKAMRRTIKNPVVAIEAFEPGESRRVEFTLDYEPITIWINTMISRNVPSRITWGPRVEVSGACGSGRRKAGGIDLRDFEEGNIVVDDQDPGFETVGGDDGGFLRRLLPSTSEESEYFEIRRILRYPPSAWKTVLHEGLFGAYVRSAECIRAGDGGARALWNTGIPEAGLYDVYCYIFDPYRKFRPKGRVKAGLDRIEHHYTIHHSDGSSGVVLMPARCEDGWNLIGRYFFEEGEAVVELSDESPVLYVIADAVKWVKKD